ncbi:MAG TPA: FdhF/YdeP family oxidoreductase [Polyangiaceae bacterium]|nr:FdhF/YdeP family oxidoreductase [Polyangiaceae bacterium]
MSPKKDAIVPAEDALPERADTHPFHARPFRGAAAGPGAVVSALRYAAETSGAVRAAKALLAVNQTDGFDCSGCAWPDPEHRGMFEFCENGARAVLHEADKRKVDAAFFAAHTVSELRAMTDHALEHQGRLVEPMVKRPGSDHYEPIPYDAAFELVARALRGLASPNEAAFYTSGRTSNEAAFLYQLFARAFGTNNLPDCSNMCHESSGKGLGNTLGIGKGTVTLADFELADLILIIGQNPGTNHPRMLTTLVDAAKRGAKIVSINPLKERGLESFAHPQRPLGVLGIGSKVSTHYVQVKINGDVALLQGVMKEVLAIERERGGVLDRAFIDDMTTGFAELERSLDAVAFDVLESASGVPRSTMRELAELYAGAERVIACWAMGLTQHKNGVANVREIVNLLLLRGNVGKPGAGACPVRGHSNVQGDRTVGIHEAPSEAFLSKLDAGVGFTSPRAHGLDVVGTIAALEEGRVKVFFAMGGNFAAATPDTPRTARALGRAALTVSVATKLNRSHLETGETALILPCLARSDLDHTGGSEQFVTVENSMGIVLAS